MASTAIGAAGEDARTITFISREHKEFYLEYLPKCRWKDVYQIKKPAGDRADVRSQKLRGRNRFLL